MPIRPTTWDSLFTLAVSLSSPSSSSSAGPQRHPPPVRSTGPEGSRRQQRLPPRRCNPTRSVASPYRVTLGADAAEDRRKQRRDHAPAPALRNQPKTVASKSPRWQRFR
ncbi:hypothetical protein M427DRAFT_57444 [Gonapodya prolifera JEL478]|uniref:Uncharacterized protein n=1 Tax=Gonapodya prolifera (strain JEL478) TaxID=1344416 RepID=A0A139ACN6_GONPJ|nr:hypothetical protein M427DRAFT_57444 [Gonapodya prolifera JEL478]|eukprot:KXS14530.1 hypothetical protein M427DRAFT_57444 [Gonapodya prolifera JEL478]